MKSHSGKPGEWSIKRRGLKPPTQTTLPSSLPPGAGGSILDEGFYLNLMRTTKKDRSDSSPQMKPQIGNNQSEMQIAHGDGESGPSYQCARETRHYKKNAVPLTKAKSHFFFVSSCKDKQQIPKGLKINIRSSQTTRTSKTNS